MMIGRSKSPDLVSRIRSGALPPVSLDPTPQPIGKSFFRFFKDLRDVF